MMFWYGGHWVFWQAVLMSIGMVALSGLVAWTVFTLVRIRSSGPRTLDDAEDAARRVLDVRLARGEITLDEYSQIRRLIGDNGDRGASEEADGDGRSRPAA